MRKAGLAAYRRAYSTALKQIKDGAARVAPHCGHLSWQRLARCVHSTRRLTKSNIHPEVIRCLSES